MRYKMTFEPELSIAHLRGHVDEHVGETLTEIRSQIRTRRAVLELSGLGILNSVGVSIWLAHIKAFDDLELGLAQCPSPFTSLCLMVPELAGNGRILSFYARYYCDRCADDQEHMGLVTAADAQAHRAYPPLACKRCGTAMATEEADLDFLQLFLPRERSA